MAPDDLQPSRETRSHAPAETAAVENVTAEQLQRDLGSVSGAAGAFVKLRAQGLSMDAVAEELGVSRRALASYVRLAHDAIRPEAADGDSRPPRAPTLERMAALVARKVTPRR